VRGLRPRRAARCPRRRPLHPRAGAAPAEARAPLGQARLLVPLSDDGAWRSWGGAGGAGGGAGAAARVLAQVERLLIRGGRTDGLGGGGTALLRVALGAPGAALRGPGWPGGGPVSGGTWARVAGAGLSADALGGHFCAWLCPSRPGAPQEEPIDVLNASAARCRAPWGALETCGLAVARRAPPGGWRGAGGDAEPLTVALLGKVLAPAPAPCDPAARRPPRAAPPRARAAYRPVRARRSGRTTRRPS
jgi:hypothetical protein